MEELRYVPRSEFARLLDAAPAGGARSRAFADLCRINALYMITQAGSGHIGSSFSCIDVLSWLWLEELDRPNEPGAAGNDLCYSSKGHDAPALYSLLVGLGKLPEESLHTLRRHGGLPGHPDVGTPYMLTNTGSLGMGVSKARGFTLARRMAGQGGRVFVVTGDGELQEGQIWESLQPAANARCGEITVIVDHNKIQSDTYVKDVSDLGDLEAKFRAFGWETARADGHDFEALSAVFARFRGITDRPKVLVADTVKGNGVTFMQQLVTGEDGTYYKFHSGAPGELDYGRALAELVARAESGFAGLGLPAPVLAGRARLPRVMPQTPERLVPAYAEELIALAGRHPELVALDADLVLDTGLIPFKNRFPAQFVECGIAEQDMVSAAGALALSGRLPVVHSFACFLSVRPNEHIYNNATERTKIVYVGSLAGILPAGPGHSHQSVRDISALAAVPGLTLLQPATAAESRLAARWAVEENPGSTYLRLVSIPCDIPFALPDGYRLEAGKGCALTEGGDVLVIGYGPVLLAQAWLAAQALAAEGVHAQVVDMPWLNRVDEGWLAGLVAPHRAILFLDDHYAAGGQGQFLAAELARLGLAGGRAVRFLAVDRIPDCGQNVEVLAAHGLDAAGIARAARAAAQAGRA